MIGISAEVSVYPLRQASLSPAIDETLRVFRTHGLVVEPGAMSTLVAGDDEAVFRALEQAFRAVAEAGHVVMHVTLSNACPVASSGSRPRTILESVEPHTPKPTGQGAVRERAEKEVR
ncbi:MAG: thiamine-binding protein [Spirochaetales bacterium]|nr:thiamine-binding protein [Spirochaetales bacterium]